MKPRRALSCGWRAGIALWVALVMLPVLLSACSPSQAKYAYGWERWFYPSISGRVVDAETGEPIEGAVAFCVWTNQQGLPGMSYTEVAKVSESISDREGRFRIDGTLDPNVEAPNFIVYKRGYAAWSNKEVFPSRERRKDFVWKSDIVIRMDRWRKEYSFNAHDDFMDFHVGAFDIGERDEYELFEAMKWEWEMQLQEDKRKVRRDEGGAH